MKYTIVGQRLFLPLLAALLADELEEDDCLL